MGFPQTRALGRSWQCGRSVSSERPYARYHLKVALDYVLFFAIFVFPLLIEFGVFFGGIWWHSDEPKDPRNGL